MKWFWIEIEIVTLVILTKIKLKEIFTAFSMLANNSALLNISSIFWYCITYYTKDNLYSVST